MLRQPFVVAVDGPAAAGKGTLAKRLADEIGLPYLDTGLLYRAVARRMLDASEDPAHTSGLKQAEWLSPEDLLRSDLRVPEVDRAASLVARQPEVRHALVGVQRRFADERGAVLDGRDIGTVIFPDALVKLYVTASPAARALRRYLQTGGDTTRPGWEEELREIETSIRARDEADSARETAPLRMAEDAVMIVTDDMDANAVLAEAVRIVKDRLAAAD
ncbi:(d)CMP kinase [Acetobacter sacchari]|uniref:Cytidylate kinase n=1 Tax=Acetobacter sacchari TaxID=2661687 RepID=A0ABS3LZB8_9PROT|nr:(d)CMP kinase [Acetobacter sacchari]MBO1361245.1 (d)CMP kinase [Acetobacter sacchari]